MATIVSRCLAACALAIALLLAGQTHAQTLSEDAASAYPIVIGTGTPSGVYFAVGKAICRLVNQQSQKVALGDEKPRLPVRCAATATPGSLFNLAELRQGSATFGIVQSDWQYHAFRGTSRFEGQPFRKLRAVLSLHPEVLQIIVGRDTPALGIADLAGKTVSIGPVGSGTRGTFEAVLAAEKFDKARFGGIADLSLAEQNQELCAGNIEMAPYLIGVPSSAVQQVISQCGGRLLEVKSPGIDALLDTNRYLARATIPSGLYTGVDIDTESIAVVATLVTTDATPDAVVYEVTRGIFERLDDLRAMHPALARLQPSTMLMDGLSIPLHSGALQYYADRGWVTAGGH